MNPTLRVHILNQLLRIKKEERIKPHVMVEDEQFSTLYNEMRKDFKNLEEKSI